MSALRVAILSPGDREARQTATGQSGRFADLHKALAAVGCSVEPAIYDDDFCDEVLEQLLGVDVVLVWVNPIQAGRPRRILDDMLRRVAHAGVFVSTHPDVILKLGTKSVLYETRDFGWGCDTHLYRSRDDILEGLSLRLHLGPRVLKQHRGSSGAGVFRVELVTGHAERVDGLADASDTQVKVRHAARGSIDELVSLADFCDQLGTYIDEASPVIDQEFQTRLAEGMVRCYLVRDKVAGFGHQAVNALISAPPGQDPPAPSERLYHPPTMVAFQALKEELENAWVPALQDRFGLDDDQLPVLWDCDFLLGPKNVEGDDSYVLCEINVSGVAPYPASAVTPIVEAVCSLG